MVSTWTPRAGQWVRFRAKVPTPILLRHEEGQPRVHTLASGLFLGKFAPERKAVQLGFKDGKAITDEALPARIVMADENGNDVTVSRNGVSRSYFFTLTPLSAEQEADFRLLGWGGVAQDVTAGTLADLSENYCRRTWPKPEGDNPAALYPDRPEHLKWCPHDELKP